MRVDATRDGDGMILVTISRNELMITNDSMLCKYILILEGCEVIIFDSACAAELWGYLDFMVCSDRLS